jgi:hypothetical protein
MLFRLMSSDLFAKIYGILAFHDFKLSDFFYFHTTTLLIKRSLHRIMVTKTALIHRLHRFLSLNSGES